ncbi:MAG: hypothetical protein R6W70_05420 [bacterium]
MIKKGWILNRRKGNSGFWYTVFFKEDSVVDCNSKIDKIYPFDYIELQLSYSKNICFIEDFRYISRSPLHEKPEHIFVASYFSKLLRRINEPGDVEYELIKSLTNLLRKPALSTEDVKAAEQHFSVVSGLPLKNDCREVFEDYTGDLFFERRSILNRLKERSS